MSRKQTWIWFLASGTDRSQTELNELFIVWAVQQYSDLWSAMRSTWALKAPRRACSRHLLQVQPQRTVDWGSLLEDGPQARELLLTGGRAGRDQCWPAGFQNCYRAGTAVGLLVFLFSTGSVYGGCPLPAPSLYGAGVGSGSWRSGAHGLFWFKALLTKKSHTQTWENQILWKQTVCRECGVQGIIRDQCLPGAGAGREKLNRLASPARPRVTPFRVVPPPPQEVQALCSPTLFPLPKHRGKLHFPTKEARTQVNIHLIPYLLNHCCSNSGQQAGCIRNIWGFGETTQRDFCEDRQATCREKYFLLWSKWLSLGRKTSKPLLGTSKDSKSKTKEDMDDKI